MSPMGAVGRSVVLPGWGQFYARKRILGTTSFVENKWSPDWCVNYPPIFPRMFTTMSMFRVALIDDKSPEALFQYNRANQRYKLRQFFSLSSQQQGVWAYSLIDSYVGANLYNAEAKANQLIDDMKRIGELGVQLEATPTQLQLGIVKFF